jgi:hypothetical protein
MLTFSLCFFFSSSSLLECQAQGGAICWEEFQQLHPNFQVDSPAPAAAVPAASAVPGAMNPPTLPANTEPAQVAGGGASGKYTISPAGRTQMSALVDWGMKHNTGKSGGRCYEYVWKYITQNGKGYGKIFKWTDAHGIRPEYARNFADFFLIPKNAQRWGLQQLKDIKNPYDAPVGSIVVVWAGAPGTAHPVAGDIAIARGNGKFINDGPNMSYGPKASFPANKLAGVWVPV